jgi:hypothetical protein
MYSEDRSGHVYGWVAIEYKPSGALTAKHAGIMSHYIVDVAVFGHVMGSSTDWGSEAHHSDYVDFHTKAKS